MNENIDVRISNYLKILSNPELVGLLDNEIIQVMKEAVAIYVATTAPKYIQDYRKQQKIEGNIGDMFAAAEQKNKFNF